MEKIEQTLDSREVAEMVDKEHKFLMRDIRRYIGQIVEGNEKYGGGCKVAPSDFFTESTYRSEQNKELPCYRITKKGCEFIAHKLTGTKGTIFTARYINRFHEMQDILSQKEVEPELPWFIRRFRGKYIMLWRDFETLTGISLDYNKPFWKAHHSELLFGIDYTWWAWHTVIDREEFLKEYGFDYGDGQCMQYFHMCGVRKVLKICERDRAYQIEQSAYDMIIGGLKAIEPPKKEIAVKKSETVSNITPVQIGIIVENEQRVLINI